MSDLLSFTIIGLVTGAVYAVAASGLVVTYTTSGVFNFAHGAIGMMGAFAYWQLHEGWGLPQIPSILLVLFVLAPAFGVLIDRVVMRGLEGTSEVTRTVVPVGLLFALIALAPIIWPPRVNRALQPFFPGEVIRLGDVAISYHQIVVICVAVAVAVGLRLLLFSTRHGVEMRAVVANRSLVQLNGGRPARASSLSWVLGCSLAALAGVLVADRFGLEVLSLTLLVINAYAAAIVGRLTSLPMTFLGAVVLGLLQSYAVGYLPSNPDWLPDGVDVVTSMRLAIPVLMLFVVLLVLPQVVPRAHGIIRSREVLDQPSVRYALAGALALVGATVVISSLLSTSDVLSWSKGFGFGLVMLSLVPLTGYGGQISLAQMSFAGLGAFAVSMWGQGGNPLGLVAAFVLPAMVGALVALPALRLRGIYLALSTLAFGVFMDRAVFTQDRIFPGGSRPVDRIRLGPLDFEDDRAYMVLLAVAFSLAGLGVVALRRGRFGRRLIAMKDSPAACATLGMNLTATKLQVFALSAGIAGVGGALLAGIQDVATISQYDTLQSLPVLLLAVAGGIGLVSGALTGGFLYASFPVVGAAVPALNNLLLLAPGLVGMSLARNPNGLASEIAGLLRPIRRRIERAPAQPAEAATRRASPAGAALLGPVADLEAAGLTRPISVEDIEMAERVLGVDGTWPSSDGDARGREEVRARAPARSR